MSVTRFVSPALTDAELRASDVEVTLDAEVVHVIVDSMPAGGSGLTDAELRATPVPVSGTVTVTDGAGSLTVDGTVAVTNAGLTELAAAINASSQMDVNLAASGITLPVSNTILSIVGGGTEAAAQRVTIASDSTGVLSVDDNGGNLSIDDGGNSITVDAPVGTPAFVRLSDGASAIATLPVSLAAVPSHAVTNIGTFAVQVDGAALTALQLIDDPVQVLGTDTYTEATSKGMTLGAVRRDADTTLVNTTNEFSPLQVDANGRLKVEAFSGETLPVSLTSTTITGTVAVTDNAGSLTVDAPVGTPVFVRLSDGSAAITTLPVKELRSGTATTTSVNDTASNTTILASNANRLGATVYNDSTVILYLKLGATASTTSFTVKMAADAYYEVPFGYTGIIDGIWASDASGAARICELT